MLNNHMKDIKGEKYGRLIVRNFAHIKKYPQYTVAYWKCICDCGNEKTIDGRNLRSGVIKSCGCLRKEINARRTKGIPFTKDHRDNISKALKGRIFSDDWRQKISESLIGIFAGENNPNWRGGVARNPYSFYFVSELREKIRERDNYQCQICGIKESELIGYHKKLAVHHKDYDKTNDKPNNLITLCESCHSKTNFNRKYWKDYFQNSYRGGENFTIVYER